MNGVDTFWRDVHPLLTRAALPVAYEEIDADVFGEELHEAPYHNADRIAVVVLTIRKE